MDFSSITKAQISEVENILNNRPRKRYGYKSPNQMFSAKLDSNLAVAFVTWIHRYLKLMVSESNQI